MVDKPTMIEKILSSLSPFRLDIKIPNIHETVRYYNRINLKNQQYNPTFTHVVISNHSEGFVEKEN